LDDVRVDRGAGRIEVVAGPMFAGKTEELLRRVRRGVIGGRAIQVFTHALDTRQVAGVVASHAGLEHPSREVGSAVAILDLVPEGTDLVAIDEAHFFGPELVSVVEELARRGLVVAVAGLSVTFAGRPFEPLPALMAMAERVDKLTAICTVCGEEAVFHQRIAPVSAGAADLVAEHVGGLEKYEARCRRHFQPP
jgi:thymidine kinase